MREIKFRAWDVFNNRHWYSDNYSNIAEFFTAMQKFIDGGNKLELEEYTGRHDKNEVEIYEGDIVRYSWSWAKDEIHTEPVEYNEASFSPFASESDDAPYPDASMCEVIGNIHEGVKNDQAINS